MTLCVACFFIAEPFLLFHDADWRSPWSLQFGLSRQSDGALGYFAFLSLGGFICQERDRARHPDGLGQILATTTLSKPLYTIGKTISNFAVLATMPIMGIAAGVMQFVRHEDVSLHITQLLARSSLSLYRSWQS